MLRRAVPTLLALGALLAGGRSLAEEEKLRLIPMAEVERRLGSPGFAVFDANVPEIWEKNHLPGAVHIVGKELARLLPPDKDAELVFYCTNPK